VTASGYAIPTGDGRHRCPARRCTASVLNRYLMCPQHWRMVPARLQRDVNSAYDNGRGLTPSGLPGETLARAQLAAITAVNATLTPN
jgi:hypothetical protein